MEKIEKILQENGISHEQIVLQWARDGVIDLDAIADKLHFNANNINYVDDAQVLPGMFMYENRKISADYSPDALGIIFGIAPKYFMVLALKSRNLPFSSDGYAVEAGDFGSLSATHFLVQMADSFGKKADAAQYCLQYDNSVISENSAFLLSNEDITKLHSNSEAVWQAFQKAGIEHDRFWTLASQPFAYAGNCPQQERTAAYYAFNSFGLFPEAVTVPLPVHPAFIVKRL